MVIRFPPHSQMIGTIRGPNAAGENICVDENLSLAPQIIPAVIEHGLFVDTRALLVLAQEKRQSPNSLSPHDLACPRSVLLGS